MDPRVVIKRRRRWVALAVVLTFVLGLVTAVYVWDRTKRAAFERKLAALRARGIPTTPAEMHAQYRLPAGVVDCTAIWQEGFLPFAAPDAFANFQNVPIIGSSGQDPPLPGTAWSDLAASEAALAHFQHSLDCFHRAAAQGGHALFPLRFEDGLSMLLEHVQHARTASRLLKLEAFARAHRGDRRGVAESLRHLATVGRAIEGEPVLISLLVMSALDRMAIETTEQLWPFAEFSDEELLALQQQWESIDPVAYYRRSIQGERMFGLTAFEQPQSIDPSVGPSALSRVPVLRWSDRLVYLELMVNIEEACPASGRGLQPGDIERVHQAFRANEARLQSRLTRISAPLTGMLLPSMSASVNALVHYETSRLCIVTALAAERYRRQTGQWPATAGDLVPHYLSWPPIDPVDGKELRLLPQNGGLLIYGVDIDGIDHGGQRGPTIGPDIGLFISAPADGK